LGMVAVQGIGREKAPLSTAVGDLRAVVSDVAPAHTSP
jgi:hypothetical protein